MEFTVKSGQAEKQKTPCLVVGVFEKRQLSEAASLLNDQSDGYINFILKRGDIQGKVGQTLLLQDIPDIPAERVLLVGCGNAKEALSPANFKEVVLASLKVISQIQIAEASSYLTDLDVDSLSTHARAQIATRIGLESLYRFDQYKSEKEKPKLKKVQWLTTQKKQLNALSKGCEEGAAIATGSAYTRDLGNTPGNICHPSYLANEAKKLAKEYTSVSCAILNEKEMRALKMGALLGVAQGSAQPPKLITIEYRGTKAKSKPVVLVGKGITFDTGGNSLKPAANMIGMKYDMCGAATVMGVLKAVAELKLPINVIGVVAAAENMPGATAIRPDDILTSLSGKTIEVLNTDAEGRLVLCDALTYCERYNPDVVIDMATLTGACVVALGHHLTAVYSNTETLAQDILKAGIQAEDKGWHMPLGELYHKQLESGVADMANIGGPTAGSITAACFLEKFAESYQWAHLDIAGTACTFTGQDRNATGRPVPMLVQYLINRCT